MAAELDLLTTNGEATGQPLYKVRGDPHWMSTPALAKRQHAVLQKAYAQNFFTGRKENKK